ncbi:hypothetical protein Poli38472_010631 [Pythium oligandrum]|uniref:Uncharacterized protein n=1 Tax=Pythium oligandrum TaxID=41045 RepID=A0A8K1C3D7_PYTOL|nr:hypothetical protein Poli38472_010631 [Pythium oligandrum]|eukprot:TMW55749.1 hypothetical protein Poli38472_010631 [Pythium oligandrum]
MMPPQIMGGGRVATATLRLQRRTVGGSDVRYFFSWISDSSEKTKAPEATPAPTHIPVLLNETVSLWVNPSTSEAKPQRFFVDGTAGFGGHSKELLLRNPEAQLLCVDRDPEILAIAKANLRDFHSRVVFHNGSYAQLDPSLLQSVGFPDQVDGICVDLGANSFHFDEPRRGFSHMRDGPLDMRYNQQDRGNLTAADVVNTFSEVQLTKIFREFGEERLAKEYAKAIVRDREERGVVFANTSDLRECIERIARKWNADGKRGKKRGGHSVSVHPATKCFQALRIYVNDELQHVATGVEQLVTQLAPQGRLATIAFHSLEDRPIKLLFRRLDTMARRAEDEEYEDYFDEDFDEDDEGEDTSAQTILQRLGSRRFRLVKRKAIKAKAEEIAENPRSRSARLRCIERVE